MTQQAAIFRGPRSDEFGTPSWVFDPLHAQYLFTHDLAATAKNAKAPRFYSANDSFLTAYVGVGRGGNADVAWCNPPFSLAEKFFEKIARLARDGLRCVCIYKSANMETRAWSHIFSACSWIAQPDRRVNYLVDGVETKGVQFASAVTGFNVDPPKVPWKYTLLRVER